MLTEEKRFLSPLNFSLVSAPTTVNKKTHSIHDGILHFVIGRTEIYHRNYRRSFMMKFIFVMMKFPFLNGPIHSSVAWLAHRNPLAGTRSLNY
jgi:hypothetical protein